MIKIKGKWLLITIVLLIVMMCGIISNTKSNLINMKNELIQIEKGEITRNDAVFIPKDYTYSMSSEAIHIGGAYFWAVPFLIIIFVLSMFYFVKYIR